MASRYARLRVVLLSLSMYAVACGDSGGAPPAAIGGDGPRNFGGGSSGSSSGADMDASTMTDAGGSTGGAMDAGQAAMVKDAGVKDAGTAPKDAGAGMDAGSQMDAGTTLDAGTGSDAGGDAGADAGPVNLNPVVDVVNPLQETDPNAGAVIVGNTLDVICHAAPAVGGDALDSSSIIASIKGGITTISGVALSTGSNDLYKATLQLATIPHGPVTVECSAKDTHKPTARSTKASASTFYDRGPLVTIVTPTAKDYLRKTNIPVVFEVAANPLNDIDLQADIDTATLQIVVNDVKYTLNKDPKIQPEATPGRYRVNYDLSNEGNPPATLPISVTVANKRAPVASAKNVSIAPPVDKDAPIIKVDCPAATVGTIYACDGKVVAGQVTISATITDPDIVTGVKGSGVDASSVHAIVTSSSGASVDDVVMTYTGKSYVGKFNANAYAALGITQLRMNVIASDNAGNQPTTDAISIYLDTVPPWVSLDPPNIREGITKVNTSYCTKSYDPLGVAINDLAVPPNSPGRSDPSQQIIRALAWERTFPGTFEYYAGLDQTSVKLYFQADVQKPLLIDRDKDHVCDGIDTTDQAAGGPVVTDLYPVASSQGQKTWMATDDSDLNTAPVTSTGVCSLALPGQFDPSTVNDWQCSGASDMTRVLGHYMGGDPTVVYGIGPLLGDACTGSYYGITPPPMGTGGWKCFAASAKDNVGNLGFSIPFRVCYLYNPGDCDGPAPSCVDDCTPPTYVQSAASVSSVRTGIPNVIPH